MSDNFYDLPPLQTDEAKPGSLDFEIVQWCDERLQRGIKFVESQIGYDKISQAIDAIFAYEKQSDVSYIPTAKGLSQTQANFVAKIAEDLTAMLTDIRYFWNYTTSNAKYEPQCRLANKAGEYWYTSRNIDLRIGDVIRFYTVAGTGVSHMYYSRRIDDFILEAEDPRNVFPVDPLSYHSFEDCAGGVILRRARTPEWVREEYNKTVKPDTESKGNFFGWLMRIIDSPGQRGGPLAKKSKGDKPIPETPTVFVNTLYLKDRRTNRTGKTIRMGPWDDDKPSSPWSYEVTPNSPLYPFGRIIVWGGGALLHDGPSPYWHGEFPVTKWTLNPWPNSWFGKAPLWDCLPLNKSINANLRVIDDHAAQVAQPAMIGDRNVSKAEMNRANTRAPGMKIKTNLASGKGIQIVNPPPLDALIWEVIKWCQEVMKTIAGTMDAGAMVSLAQMPSDDTIDAIMKAMTPGVRLRSRILEGCYKQVARQYLYNFWEWDTLAKRVAVFGPQSVTKEDFDYSPRVGIPDDIPDGEPGDIAAAAEAMGSRNPRPLYERAKAMLMSFLCKFDPSSLLNTAAQQELMRYFLLAKMGYVSVFTLMEKMGIMNFAPADLVVPPDEIGRLALQQKLGIGMIANAQGRKATDAAPPSMGQNSNGPTITTS